MTSKLDELNDEELEASLLWTDDEGESEVIDLSDEELLLNGPDGTPKASLIDELGNDNFDHIDGDILKKCDENEQEDDLDVKHSIDTTIIGPCANNKEEIVDLDVTFNTRDALENSHVSDSESVLDQTITNVESSDILMEQNSFPASSPHNSIINSNQYEPSLNEQKPDQSPSNLPQTENVIPPSTQSDLNISSSNSVVEVAPPSKQPETDIKCDDCDCSIIEIPPPHLQERDEGVIKTNISDNEMSDQFKCHLNDQKTELNGSSDYPISVTSQNNEDTLLALKNIDSDLQGKSSINISTSDPALTIDDAIKSIRQAVAKRAKSNSDEEAPPEKRICSSVDSSKLDQESSDNNLNKLVNSNIPSIPSNPSNEVLDPNKKRPIVSFNFKNYSKNSTSNSYDCKTCTLKFKDELKFESHLIACHAMSLNINDFDIDLHQYYKQKKEKVIAQCKSTLPKLTSQDGNIDAALIKEYNQNVKLYPAQKNAQYFCKICENVYSTKNLIIGHLRSSKHILQKGKLS